MTARRRYPRRRPLTEFARRSPLHALAAGLIRFALLAGLALVFYVVVMNVLAPDLVDDLVDEFRNQTR